jgi:hypothetical protein
MDACLGIHVSLVLSFKHLLRCEFSISEGIENIQVNLFMILITIFIN